MQLDKSTLKKLALLIISGIAVYWLLQNYSIIGHALGFAWGIIFPFILGGIIAFLINLPMHAIETRLFKDRFPRTRRIFSFLITIVLMLLVLALVIFLVVPQLVNTVSMLVADMPVYLKRIQENLMPLQKYIPELQRFIQMLDWNKLGSTLFSWVQTGFGSVFNSAIGVATSVVNGATSFIIAFIFSIYVLFDKEHMGAQLSSILQAFIGAERYKKFQDFTCLANRTFSRFVTGQCLEAVAIGTVYIIILGIGRFDYAFLIGVIIGFTSLIPILGAFIGCIVGALLIWVSSGLWRTIAFIILFLVVQQFDGNLMYPRIVGTSIGLPPMWVLVAVTIGGGLMGVFGMLFFIPLTSVFYTLLRQSTVKRLEAQGISSPLDSYHINRPKKPKKVPKMKKK